MRSQCTADSTDYGMNSNSLTHIQLHFSPSNVLFLRMETMDSHYQPDPS